MRSFEVKPLQTHGRYVETWVPPVERFVRYERSDERWARPLGIGTVKSELEALYDVRDERRNLIGYTVHNPMCIRNRPFLTLTYAECPSYRRWRPEEILVRAEEREIYLEVVDYGMGNEIFRNWQASLQDSLLLIEMGWVSVMGRDNRHDWEYELRRRMAENYWDTVGVY